VVERVPHISSPAFYAVAAPPPAGRAGTHDTRAADVARPCPGPPPTVDAFRAGPGAVPFADYLRALAMRARVAAGDPVVSPSSPTPPHQLPPRRDDTLARLGDLPPPAPPPAPRAVAFEETIRRTLGSGRMIDLVI
jgi:hypothetical protein